MKNIVDPNNQKIIYRVHNDGDITKGDSNEIVGHIHPDGDVTKGTGRELIGRIHSDGDVTKGTSREIVAHIHQDGDITEGTGRKIIGRLSETSGEWKNDGGIEMFACIMGIFFAVMCLYFSVFLLPQYLVDMFKTMVEEEDIEEIVSFIVVLISAFGASVFGNFLAGKAAKIHVRIRYSYIISYILQLIVVVIMDNLYYHDLVGIMGFVSILLVPALIAVLPALITSAVCMCIEIVKRDSK